MVTAKKVAVLTTCVTVISVASFAAGRWSARRNTTQEGTVSGVVNTQTTTTTTTHEHTTPTTTVSVRRVRPRPTVPVPVQPSQPAPCLPCLACDPCPPIEETTTTTTTGQVTRDTTTVAQATASEQSSATYSKHTSYDAPSVTLLGTLSVNTKDWSQGPAYGLAATFRVLGPVTVGAAFDSSMRGTVMAGVTF